MSRPETKLDHGDDTVPIFNPGDNSQLIFDESSIIKFEVNPRFAYGAKEIAANTCQFIDEDHVVFPVSRHLWKYHVSMRKMFFMARRSHPSTPFISVSQNRRRLAICETVAKGTKKSQITIMDLTSRPEPTVCWKLQHTMKGIVGSCEFSADAKVIAVHVQYPARERKIGSKAQGAVAIWKCDTKKFLGCREVTAPIRQLSVNPEDNYLICATGNNYIRYLKCAGNSLDEVPLLKRLKERSYDFQDHAWISPQTLVVVTDSAGVSIFQKGILKQTISCTQDGKTVHEEITTICAYKEGFILGTSLGSLILYRIDKSQGFQQYVAWKEYDTKKSSPIVSLCISPTKETVGVVIKEFGFMTFDITRSFAPGEYPFVASVTPCGYVTAVATCEHKQLLVTCGNDNTIRVWPSIRSSQTVVSSSIQHTFDERPLAMDIHCDGIKLLIVFRHHVTLWHLLSGGLKLSHTYAPPLPINSRSSIIVKYSHNGDKFVLVLGNHILIYRSLTMALLNHIPDNKEDIKTIEWSQNDDFIASAGADGAVYAWNVFTLERVQDYVDKSWRKLFCLHIDWGRRWEHRKNLGMVVSKAQRGAFAHTLKYHAEEPPPEFEHQMIRREDNIKFNSTPGDILVCGNSREGFKMMNIAGSGVAFDVVVTGDVGNDRTGGFSVNCMVIDETRNLLICGSRTGAILLFKWPLVRDESKGVYRTHCHARYSIHDGAVQHLALMKESGVLFSVGEEGNLFVLDIGFHDHHDHFVIRSHAQKKIDEALIDNITPHVSSTIQLSLDENIFVGDSSVVLVDKDHYNRITKAASEHEVELKKLSSAAEFKLKATKEQYNEDLRLLREDMESLLDSKNKAIEEQKALVKEARSKRNKERQEAKDIIAAKTFDVREAYEAKLYHQYNEFDEKCTSMEKTLKSKETLLSLHEGEKQKIKDQHKEEIAKIQAEYEAKIKQLKTTQDEIIRDYEEVVDQLQDEQDLQILKLQKAHANELAKYREHTASAFAERSAYKTKYDASLHQVTSLRIDQAKTEEKLNVHGKVISHLQTELKQSKRKVREKEHDLSKRQHMLANVRKDNNMLNNFIALLEHRIAELEEREAPAHRYLTDLKEQIEDMNRELFDMQQGQRLLEQLAQKKAGQNTRLTKSVTNLQHTLAKRERRWHQAVKELRHIVEYTPVIEWEKALRAFYVEFVGSIGKKQSDEKEVTNQDKVYMALERQRRHLENSMITMKKALKTAHHRRRFEADKYIARNTLFLAEVNELREQNKKLEHKCKKYMALALTSAAGNATAEIKRLKGEDRDRDRDRSGQNTSRSDASRPSTSKSTRSNSSRVETASGRRRRKQRAGGMSSGRLIKGSTRPMSAVSTLSNELKQANDQLQAINQTVELQKLEISHLQEGVNVALDLAQHRISFPPAGDAVSRLDRKLSQALLANTPSSSSMGALRSSASTGSLSSQRSLLDDTPTGTPGQGGKLYLQPLGDPTNPVDAARMASEAAHSKNNIPPSASTAARVSFSRIRRGSFREQEAALDTLNTLSKAAGSSAETDIKSANTRKRSFRRSGAKPISTAYSHGPKLTK